jgi:hypothetical protein
MEFDYDEYGYLIPGEPIEVTLETFASEFVVNEHRSAIFSEYKLFVSELVELIQEPFYQWLNGSYVSKHPRPKDIDVITFVSNDCYERLERELSALRRLHAKLDAYFVKEYPLGHPRRFVTEFDKVEWRFLFSTDRRKRGKGFVQIKF